MPFNTSIQKDPDIVEEHSQYKVEDPDNVAVAGRFRVELAYHAVARFDTPSLLVELKNPLWSSRQVCAQKILHPFRVNRLNHVNPYPLGVVVEAFRVMHLKR